MNSLDNQISWQIAFYTIEYTILIGFMFQEASISMNDLDLSNSFPNTFSPIDETVLQDMNKGNSGRLSNSLDLQSKIQTNVSVERPSVNR